MAKNLPYVWHHSQKNRNPKPQFFLLQTQRLVKSFEGLDRSLAKSSEELCSWKDNQNIIVFSPVSKYDIFVCLQPKYYKHSAIFVFGHFCNKLTWFLSAFQKEFWSLTQKIWSFLFNAKCFFSKNDYIFFGPSCNYVLRFTDCFAFVDFQSQLKLITMYLLGCWTSNKGFGLHSKTY